MTKEHKAAVLLAKHGNVEVITRPTPVPGSKEVLVKVTSAAINPVDWKVGSYEPIINTYSRLEYIIDTGMLVEEYPAVLGTDGAGIIESVGSDVTGLKRGDRVFFQGRYIPDLATFQQYVIADSELLSKIPSNISDDQAATIPVASIPALLAFFQNTGIPFPLKGETATGTPVLILGGSSSLGQYAIQIARIAGFNPIVTTSSEQHSEYLKSLGATHVFDRNVDVKTIQSAFPKRVSLVFDTISLSSTQLLAFEVLTTPTTIQGAKLAITLPVDPEFKGKNEALGRDSITVNHVLGISHLHRELTLPFWRVLENWIETGKYVPNRVQLVPGGLSGLTDGLELSRKGVSGVKLVLQLGE